MSISEKELQASYYKPDDKKKKQKVELNPPIVVAYYTLLGKQDNVDTTGQPLLTLLDEEGSLCNEGDCYAKMVNDTYFIKTISGQLFNPLGMYADKKKFKKQAGSYALKWERVAKKAFDNYLLFLRTKNAAYFLLAEREKTYG